MAHTVGHAPIIIWAVQRRGSGAPFGVACIRFVALCFQPCCVRKGFSLADRFLPISIIALSEGWIRSWILTVCGRAVRSGWLDPWVLDIDTLSLAQGRARQGDRFHVDQRRASLRTHRSACRRSRDPRSASHTLSPNAPSSVPRCRLGRRAGRERSRMCAGDVETVPTLSGPFVKGRYIGAHK